MHSISISCHVGLKGSNILFLFIKFNLPRKLQDHNTNLSRMRNKEGRDVAQKKEISQKKSLRIF